MAQIWWKNRFFGGSICKKILKNLLLLRAPPLQVSWYATERRLIFIPRQLVVKKTSNYIGATCSSIATVSALLRLTQWRSRKSVKGAPKAQFFFRIFFNLTPRKTYFIIEFEPFWAKINVNSPNFWLKIGNTANYLGATYRRSGS